MEENNDTGIIKPFILIINKIESISKIDFILKF